MLPPTKIRQPALLRAPWSWDTPVRSAPRLRSSSWPWTNSIASWRLGPRAPHTLCMAQNTGWEERWSDYEDDKWMWITTIRTGVIPAGWRLMQRSLEAATLVVYDVISPRLGISYAQAEIGVKAVAAIVAITFLRSLASVMFNLLVLCIVAFAGYSLATRDREGQRPTAGAGEETDGRTREDYPPFSEARKRRRGREGDLADVWFEDEEDNWEGQRRPPRNARDDGESTHRQYIR